MEDCKCTEIIREMIADLEIPFHVRYPAINPPPAVSQNVWGDSDEDEGECSSEADDDSDGTTRWT